MDDDDDNNNVNKMKTIGGKYNGSNNDAFTRSSVYGACWKSGTLTRVGKKIRHLGNVSFYYYGTERQLFNVY